MTTLSSSRHQVASGNHVPDGVLATIGNTPLVRLSHLFSGTDVYAKLERVNPGGSTKDRPARHMVEAALADGRAVPGSTTIVESTSGNLGVALAQVCAYHGIDLRIVTDPKVTPTNLNAMRALGARVDIVTDRDQASGEYLPTRLRLVHRIVAETPGALWLNQYANPDNARAHHRTAHELLDAVGEPDAVVVATGSCGSIRGVSQYVRAASARTRIIAVDACGSAIFGSHAPPAPPYGRNLPGHGSTMVPALFSPDLADDVVYVTDAECIAAARMVTRAEAMLVGGSSGAVVAAIIRRLASLPPGARIATIFPDGGERYLHTVYDDHWVQDTIGFAAVDQATRTLQEALSW